MTIRRSSTTTKLLFVDMVLLFKCIVVLIICNVVII